MENLRRAKQIILWGASYLGQEIGKYLSEQNIPYAFYWDARYKEIGNLNGKKVIKPFTEIEDTRYSVVLLCIGNTAIRANLLQRLHEHGIKNIRLGDELYENYICPFNEETGINGEICNGTMICRSMFCPRLHNIVKQQNNRGGIFLPNLTFMITTHCSLGCKYCVSYINSYDKLHRKHIAIERIEKDIDAIFSAVDGVGSITVQGGEPFLHPQIDRIIQKILDRKNIGIVSVATNGIFKISEKKLQPFKDSRLNVAFSGYYDALSDETLKIYYNNINLMKKNNIPHTIGVQVPEWTIPSTLWNRHYSQEIMTAKKQSCHLPWRCMQVMDGKLYPCLFSVSLHGIGIADYPKDYVDLDGANLSTGILNFMKREYYDSCGHCAGGQGSTGMAGEQGFYDFITPEVEHDV